MYRQLASVFGIAVALLAALQAHASMNQAREAEAAFEKWVETRQLISEVESEWAADKKILDAEAALLEQRIDRLEKDIARLENAATAAVTKRRELTQERDQLRRQATRFEAELQPLTSKLKAVTQRLPKPLSDEVDRLTSLLTSEMAPSRPASDRLVAILGILREADRFNRRVTLRKEVQTVADNRRIQVETLYWGLAFAFAADEAATVANFGLPVENGWTFQSAEKHARATRELLDIADGKSEDVRFIALPIELK